MEPNLEGRDPPRPRYLQWLFRRQPETLVSGGPEACVFAFASGKGGTGKSFLATNFAVALHRLGMRTCVVDCDFGLGNAHLLFGVNPRLTMQHLLSGQATVEQVLLPTPYGPGLVPGGSGIRGLAELDDRRMLLFGKSLGWLARRHDVLVLDGAAGLSAQSLMTTLAAREVVLVTNPEIAALTDAYALIKCLARQPGGPTIHVVVNRVTDPGLGWSTYQRLADVARRFAGCSIHYAGEIPEDPAVTQRRLGQPPLVLSHPRCRTSQAVSAMVQTLEAGTGPFVPRVVSQEDGLENRIRATWARR